MECHRSSIVCNDDLFAHPLVLDIQHRSAERIPRTVHSSADDHVARSPAGRTRIVVLDYQARIAPDPDKYVYRIGLPSAPAPIATLFTVVVSRGQVDQRPSIWCIALVPLQTRYRRSPPADSQPTAHVLPPSAWNASDVIDKSSILRPTPVTSFPHTGGSGVTQSIHRASSTRPTPQPFVKPWQPR